MPTAYKGKIRISCKQDKCVKDKIKRDVTPDCFVCGHSQSEVLDLEDKVVCMIGELKEVGDSSFVEIPDKATEKKMDSGIRRNDKKKGLDSGLRRNDKE